VRRAPLKDWGILAAEAGGFKRQCDCFVTKRLAAHELALKEVTNQLHFEQCLWGSKFPRRSIWKKESFTQRHQGNTKGTKKFLVPSGLPWCLCVRQLLRIDHSQIQVDRKKQSKS